MTAIELVICSQAAAVDRSLTTNLFAANSS